jgi:hypothetical protein
MWNKSSMNENTTWHIYLYLQEYPKFKLKDSYAHSSAIAYEGTERSDRYAKGIKWMNETWKRTHTD